VSDGNCVCSECGHSDSVRDSIWISVICTICVYVIFAFLLIPFAAVHPLSYFMNLTFSIDFDLLFFGFSFVFAFL